MPRRLPLCTLHFALCTLLLAGCPSPADTQPGPSPVHVVTDPNLGKHIADAAARAQLAALYAAAAEQIAFDGQQDAPRIKSTIDAVEFVGRLNQYRWRGDNKLATTAFSDALDAAWLERFGRDDKPLDDDLRRKVVTFFQFVSLSLVAQ